MGDSTVGGAPPVSEGVETTFQLPREVEMLANALSRIHGKVIVRRERAGLQLYMACPSCLMLDGKRELNKRHLSVNGERYCGLGKFAQRVGQYEADSSGLCMKENKRYSISDLKAMSPIAERGYPDAPTGVVKPAAGKCLIDDGNGNMIPDHPGQVVSLIDLPAEHPAVLYLTNRNFHIQSLVDQFRCGFCTQEAPENGAIDRYYRRLPKGWRDTPQNRIIFYADVLGVQRGWQARVLEYVNPEDGYKYYLHPYRNTWEPMEFKDPETKKWKPLPHVEANESCLWNLSKYKTAFSSVRNEMLMGWDAALRWNMMHRAGKKTFVIVCEGPLDAARFGPPAVALLGRYLAPEQIRMLRMCFDVVIFAGQNDKVSRELEQEAQRAFLGQCPYAGMFPVETVKDFGDLTYMSAWATALPVLESLQISLS